MAAPHERHRNNVKAGVFVSATIMLSLIVVVILKDAWSTFFITRNEYIVTFSVEAGVQSLTSGSVVRLGGLELGKVTSIQIEGLRNGEDVVVDANSTNSSGKFNTIIVQMELNNRVPLYSNAEAMVKAALIGSESWIEISNIGHTEDRDGNGVADGYILLPGELTDKNNWLTGRDGGTLLSAVIGPISARKTDEIIDNVAQITGEVRRDWNEYIRPTLADANEGVANFRNLMAQVDSDWPRWAITVDQVLTNTLSASDKLDLAMDDGRALIKNAEGSVDRVNKLIDDNLPTIEEFMANLNSAGEDVRSVADRIANDTINKVEALLDRGIDGVDSFSRTTAKIELEFDMLAPELRDIMANLQIASTELSLTIAEIRTDPWRLLYRPKTEELEHENLYFAATKFAYASSELKIASQSVDRAIANHKAYLIGNPQKLIELQNQLAESMERYTKAQDQLLSILKGSQP